LVDKVTEYLYGSKTPHTVITNGLFYPDGIAIDGSGNLYVGNLGGRYVASNIVVYPAGSKSPSRTITDGITWPVGVAVDSNGGLDVANLEQNNVEEYHSGQGKPYQTITDALHLPGAISVNAKGWLYVGNTEDHYSGVLKFPPGSLKPSKREISLYFANGLAYYPPLLP
jgi:serine/threonine protein kinase, bacterial